jgi:PAS domain-containing protein
MNMKDSCTGSHEKQESEYKRKRLLELEKEIAELRTENEQLRQQQLHLLQTKINQPLSSTTVSNDESMLLQRCAMQQAIQESKERHDTLFENMKQGVVYHDCTGQTTAANASALRILGLTMDQLLGKSPMDPQWKFIRDDGSDLPFEEYPAVVALQGIPVTNLKMGVYNPMEQGFRWILLDAMPRFRNGEEKPYQVYTIFTDITQEQEMKTNLVRAKEMAEETDQLKSGKESERKVW